MIVVDSSAMIEVLIGEVDTTSRLVDRTLAAPHLIDAEVGHVLRRKALITKELSSETAATALDQFAATAVIRYDHVDLMGRAWELRHNLSVYDALYVALAEMLEAPLVTVDTRLAGAPGVHAVVEVLPMGA